MKLVIFIKFLKVYLPRKKQGGFIWRALNVFMTAIFKSRDLSSTQSKNSICSLIHQFDITLDGVYKYRIGYKHLKSSYELNNVCSDVRRTWILIFWWVRSLCFLQSLKWWRVGDRWIGERLQDFKLAW